MINKPSICWLCWKPMMMKWSKCTKYLSAQICPESHNFLKSDLFSGPEMGQILRVNIWRVSHILDIISRLTSSARWNYTVHGNHYFDVLGLPSMYPSNISLAVMCLSPWHDTTDDSNSFDVVSRHETITCLIFTNPHHWSTTCLLFTYLRRRVNPVKSKLDDIWSTLLDIARLSFKNLILNLIFKIKIGMKFQ